MRTCFGRRVYLERGRCTTGIVAGKTVIALVTNLHHRMFPESQASINVWKAGEYKVK